MKYRFLLYCSIIVLFTNCARNTKIKDKGFQVGTNVNNGDNSKIEGLNKDSLKFDTRPSSVLLTGNSNVRLTTIYRVNYNKNNTKSFIGSNNFYSKYEDNEIKNGNNWNNHIMPGFEAVTGYNLVNVSHFDIKENKTNYFFEKPVLIKTLYYPTLLNDTLNFKPISRNYFMISAYNEDTNKDGFINQSDLRRLFLFNIKGEKVKLLIPENYSVIKSEYDLAKDFMYVFAQLDTNSNGKQDEGESTHVFWIDLNEPSKSGRQY